MIRSKKKPLKKRYLFNSRSIKRKATAGYKYLGGLNGGACASSSTVKSVGVKPIYQRFFTLQKYDVAKQIQKLFFMHVVKILNLGQ